MPNGSPRSPLTVAQIRQVQQLRREGSPLSRIADRFRVTPRTVYRACEIKVDDVALSGWVAAFGISGDGPPRQLEPWRPVDTEVA